VPFRMSPGHLPFTKVMILSGDGPVGSFEDMKRPAGPTSSSEGPVLKQLIPYIWPDTATTVLIDKFKMISNGLAEEIAKCLRDDRLQYVIDHVNKKAVPAYFKHYLFTIDVKQKIDALANKTFKYDHIEENGFYGMVFRNLQQRSPCSRRM
jgi:hypothetical protein